VLVGVGLYLVQHHSRLGALIRAGVDDRETASAMGIDIDRLFMIMFVVGAGLAGLAGVAASGALTIRPGADTDILLFALVVSETRLLLSYIERRVLRGRDATLPLYQIYDSFVYCIPLELKKVVNTELSDISVSRQAEHVRTRVENSHGILKDCFQQSVVQMAQALDPGVEGLHIFPDFTAKLEQSVQLRDNLARLIGAVRIFQAVRDEPAAQAMKAQISAFYDHSMKDLMYRDWSGFELFFIEILKCTSLPALQQIGHRFETFLMTLYREVQKRSILQTAPASDAVLTLDA